MRNGSTQDTGLDRGYRPVASVALRNAQIRLTADYELLMQRLLGLV